MQLGSDLERSQPLFSGHMSIQKMVLHSFPYYIYRRGKRGLVGLFNFDSHKLFGRVNSITIKKLPTRKEKVGVSPEMAKKSSTESDTAAALNFKETELTLGLPGESRNQKSGMKRGFSEAVDLSLGSSSVGNKDKDDHSESEISEAAKPPTAKAQVVGWPPVRSFRKNVMKNCKYVKVAVDGAPYLRKVDLEVYNSYQQLLGALEEMFTCFTIRNQMNERKLMDPVNGSEYVPTYEDKDGDWMLVGDVPWKMFVESCKRLRLMKSSEAIGLAPGTPSKCSSSSC